MVLPKILLANNNKISNFKLLFITSFNVYEMIYP